MRSIFVLSSSFGIALGLACGGGDDVASGDSTGEAPACEHGTASPCACSDGRMGTQVCNHEGTGFEPCVCDDPSGGTTASTSPDGTSDGTGEADLDGMDVSTDDGDGSTAAAEGSSSGGSEGGPIGAAPEAAIFHPSDGEQRVVDVAIPFIGEGTDLEDGALTGAALQWSSDVDGPIGQGEMFDAPLSTLGDHVITLTATDADGNTAEATITLTIVAP